MNEPRLLPASSFPEELNDLQASIPASLWMRGSVDVLGVRPRVAIVGTRRATPYGLRVTHELSGALARAGACIVSGLAVGIDGAAHRAALDTGGSTIAILGTGVDVVFPKSNRQIYLEMCERGLLLSELEPGEHGMKFTFPARNRIIAALAQLTIVVEAPEKSGALITAERASDIGRAVAAVPGPIDQPQSIGSNRLLREGAQVISSIEDALALVGLTPPPRAPRAEPTSDDGVVWAALSRGALDIDALCHASGLPAAQCLAAVTRLELAGSIECALSGEIRRR
jgi:DNA processing protein